MCIDLASSLGCKTSGAVFSFTGRPAALYMAGSERRPCRQGVFSQCHRLLPNIKTCILIGRSGLSFLVIERFDPSRPLKAAGKPPSLCSPGFHSACEANHFRFQQAGWSFLGYDGAWLLGILTTSDIHASGNMSCRAPFPPLFRDAHYVHCIRGITLH